MDMSPLTLFYSRVPLLQGREQCPPFGRWAMGVRYMRIADSIACSTCMPIGKFGVWIGFI